MTHHGRHRRRQALWLLVATSVAVAAVVGATWLVAAAVLDREDRVDATPSTENTFATTAAAQPAMTRALNDCRTVQRHLSPNLVAVDSAVEQWRIHIDAMRDLVAGRITLEEATAFWEATRVQGKRTLAAWQRTDAGYRAARTECAPPGTASGPNDALQACRVVQQGGEAVLAAARTTLPDWGRHIRHMDALRKGDLSATRALHLWHGMYQSGRDGVRQYDAARRDLQALPACPLV
jgi:hypothetical protein